MTDYMDRQRPSIESVLPCSVHAGTRDLIKRAVTSAEPVVVNLVGPRWIGKSSLLRCLEPAREPSLAEMLYIYVDFKEDNSRQTDPFVNVAEELISALKRRPTVKIDPGILVEKSLEKRLRALSDLMHTYGIRPLICIDHLDKYLRNTRESVELMQPLTILMDSASIILATERTLTDISPELAASPFVHRALVMSLGLLDKEGAIQLLKDLDNEGDKPRESASPKLSDEDMDMLIRLVGRHPYVLFRGGQQARALLHESADSQRRITANDVRALIEPALRPIFEVFWREHEGQLRKFHLSQTSSTAEQDEPTKIAMRANRQELQRAALIYEDPAQKEEEKFNYFSPLFESFVFQKVALSASPQEPSPSRSTKREEILALLDVRQGTRESELLDVLISNAGSIVSDASLQTMVWGGEAPERAIVTTVNRLRAKLQQHERKIGGRIVRIRNQGYRFEWNN